MWNVLCDTSCTNDVEIRSARDIMRDWLSDDSLGDDAPLDSFQPTPVHDADTEFCKLCTKIEQTDATGVASSKASLIPVLDAVNELATSADAKRVFVMLNGANEGVFVEYADDAELSCLEMLANRAARRLGVSEIDLSLPKRLYSVNGVPIASADALLRWHRVVHLLLEQETWVWPGIEVGFSWKLNNQWHLQTVALAPKLLYVHNLISSVLCEQLRNNSVDRMYKSPVKVSKISVVFLLLYALFCFFFVSHRSFVSEL
jgi:hypothetical protein